jgi:hypothetical protein
VRAPPPADPTGKPWFRPVGAGDLARQGHRGIRHRSTAGDLVEPHPQPRERLLVDGLLELDEALLHLSGVGDEDAQHARGRQRDELDVPYSGAAEARVLHDGQLLRERGDEANRAREEFVEVARLAEERLDRLALRPRERPHVAELVDEDAIALVGRDATRRRVRRRDELLLLEEGHVVADRRSGHAERVALHDGLRAHRLT